MTKHGDYGKRLWRIWNEMNHRCYVKTASRYPYYGGKGIRVCARWRWPDGYEAFRDDMGSPPTEKHEIDRINTSAGYSPGNCRWATRSENMRNTSRARFLTIDGVTKHVCEWATEAKMNVRTLWVRWVRWGDAKRALTAPVGKYVRREA